MTAICNVHERVIDAPVAAVGVLLDRLSAPNDPIFPAPAWPRMCLDGPLAVGADGGHGRIRYHVTAYEPGRRVRFDTPPGGGLRGYHELTVAPLDAEHCRVRHVLECEVRGLVRLQWTCAIRHIHDTMIEEIFDNIERAAADGVTRPTRWSPWVRLLHRLAWARPQASTRPAAAQLIRTSLDRTDYEDAYRMELLPGQPRDPAAWTGILRDAFPVLAQAGGELLLDVNTAGLTARASILIDERYVTLSTAVKADGLRARLYWGLVKRVHPFMARTMFRRTHRRLALAAPSAGERSRTASLGASTAGSPNAG
ncbi:hypothetical protein GCM10010503_40840 [Streptomyces lucensis JCM 4490]|uniref:DUF2867 domain-containing protein n=1 Tax=Streptomyces lucensis JCM 4490 TaxID=1306176 RepID=A0A918MT45_9ACTN|nr:DUF2867 domain-containing protein [Streptomyces lucensis]GGW59491.1 hypothetical protein GCM10010503_40840 [Streptomyces lucensis JCM 4490]